MEGKIKYVDDISLAYAIDKLKEYISNHYASKSEIENMNTILDTINGEVV